ncbi:hypothetical protein [Rhodococcus sp. no. 34]
MADLRPSHLETWVKATQDKSLAPGTIKTRFNNVRSVLRAAKRDKVLADGPTLSVTLPRRRRAEVAMIIPHPSRWGTDPRVLRVVLRLHRPVLVLRSTVRRMRRPKLDR